MINHFTFNGTSTADLGLIVSGVSIFGAGSRKVEKAGIPGRNGDLQIELGGFNNYSVRYIVSITDNFTASAEQIREWLLESKGYCELTDTYHPDEIRKACFNSDIEFTTTSLYKYGQATIQFDCLPQRYLIRNTPVTVSANYTDTTNSSLFLTTTPAPLLITLNGDSSNSATVTGTNYIKIIRKNLLSKDTYKTSTRLYLGNTDSTYGIHLPAGNYTFTKKSSVSLSAHYREKNDGSNTTIFSTANGLKSRSFTLAAEGDYHFYLYKSSSFSESDVEYFMLERGSTATAYEEYTEQLYPLHLGTIELATGDSLIKTSGKWYIHNTNDDTEITDSTLISELNAIQGATSYNGQTNILQNANANLFTLNVRSFEAEDVPSSYNGEPIIEASGTGLIDFNGEVIEVLSAPVTINCQTLQCYNGSVNMNNSVRINEFPTIKKGSNLVACEMALTITPNNWRH